MARRFRTSDGVLLAVAEAGPADAPVTAVLLHGWTGDHTLWNRVLPHLPGIRVLAPDHRGHGDSQPAPRGSTTIARLADDTAELIARFAPTGPLVLVGHSMGGMTIMLLAERHPHLLARTRGTLLAATSAGRLHEVTFGLPAPLLALATRRPRRPRPGERPDTSAPTAPAPTRPAAPSRPSEHSGSSARSLRRSPGALPVRNRLLARRLIRWLVFGRRPSPADVRAVVDQVARTHRGSSAGFRSALVRHDATAALAGLAAVPTVVLVGGRDRLTPPDHGRSLAAALPGADLVEYADAGHMLPYERAAEIAAHIRKLAGHG